MYNLLFFLWPAIVLQSNAYRILGLFPFDAPSHFVLFEVLCKNLVKRGHTVDVVSPFPQKNPIGNYTDLVSINVDKNNTLKSVDNALYAKHNQIRVLAEVGTGVCQFLENKEMQNFTQILLQQEPYDVIIIEIFGHDCYTAFGHLLKIPIIGVITGLENVWVDCYMGSPLNLAYTHHVYYEDPENFSHFRFWDRFKNAVTALEDVLTFQDMTEIQTDIMRKYIGPDVPNIHEIRKNLALVLVNTHFSLFGAKARLTNVIEIGGLHLENYQQSMDSDLKEWMDDSKDGVVLFSFGSLIKIETLPKKTLESIYSSFSKISPVRILMKVTNENSFDSSQLPENVKTFTWIPQMSVLSHKNTRAFISHGGIMGLLEAIHSGVPMIGIPFFHDQKRNVYMCASKNILIPIPYEKFNEESLDDALKNILWDPKYKKAVMKVAKQFWDRPISATETAMFWIEYVIRNGDSLLKSPAADLRWWEVMLFDIYTLIFSIFAFVVVSTIYFLAILVFRICKYDKKHLE